MHIQTLLRHASMPLRVGLGWREPGSDVPMVAIVTESGLVFATDVTEREPVRAHPGAPGPVVATDGRLFVFYSRSTARSMAAFDLATGARQWDVDLRAVHHGYPDASASADRVWFANFHTLDAYDAASVVSSW